MSTKQAVVLTKNANDLIEVDVCVINNWEGFEKLIQFLQNEYSISILEKFEGPDARRWILKSGDSSFELIYEDPYGNTLISTNTESNKLVEAIGLDLKQRLSNA